MQVRVHQAEGQILDFIVSVALNKGVGSLRNEVLALRLEQGVRPGPYSTDYSYGGPAKAAAGVATRQLANGTWQAIASADLGFDHSPQWKEFTMANLSRGAVTSHRQRFDGPTELVAAMRCLAAARLGEVVDVPDQLNPKADQVAYA